MEGSDYQGELSPIQGELTSVGPDSTVGLHECVIPQYGLHDATPGCRCSSGVFTWVLFWSFRLLICVVMFLCFLFTIFLFVYYLLSHFDVSLLCYLTHLSLMAKIHAKSTVILVYQLCLHRDGSTSQFVFCLHFSMISGKIHTIFTIICVSITLTIIKSIIFISLEKNQVVGKSGAVTRSTN